MSRACSQNEKGMSASSILTAKSTGKRRLGRSRHRWEDNIRMDLREIVLHCIEGVVIAVQCTETFSLFIVLPHLLLPS